jgi:hypothetical protein
MPEQITVTIGGEAIELPLVLNFATLERVWPAWKAFVEADDGIKQTSAACAFVAHVLVDTKPELTVFEIKKRLRVNRLDGSDERPQLREVIDRILIASGLIDPERDAPPAQPEPAADGSTGQTSTT